MSSETAVERRSAVVPLVDGSTIAKLAELEAAAAKAADDERGQLRHGTKSKAAALAKEWEDFRDEAEGAARTVTVWAIGRRDWMKLADAHPPREGENTDALYGVNMETFPHELVALAILEPGEGDNFDERVELGTKRADALDLSVVPWRRLASAAFNVNTGDDALPKYSLVSLLRAQRERDSTQQPDSEPPPANSKAKTAKKSTRSST